MWDHRLVRYAAVGVANTFFGLVVIFAAKSLLGLGDVAANLVGYGSGIALGFALNRSWTFGHENDALGALARYAFVLLAAYSVNLITVLLAIRVLGINSYLAQALGVAPYFVIGYLGSRLFAFAPAR